MAIPRDRRPLRKPATIWFALVLSAAFLSMLRGQAYFARAGNDNQPPAQAIDERIELANSLIKCSNPMAQGEGYLLLGRIRVAQGMRANGLELYRKGLKLVHPRVSDRELDKRIEQEPAFSTPAKRMDTYSGGSNVATVAQASAQQMFPQAPQQQHPTPPPGSILRVAQPPQPPPQPLPEPPPPVTEPSPELPSQGRKSVAGERPTIASQPENRGAPESFARPEPDQAPPDVGNLFRFSNTGLGVEVQQRSPVVGDPRIRGTHFGEIVTQADGGYWFPARVDLDSVISKLSVDNINNILIIRGPFSARYGPGFAFMDVVTNPTPRSQSGEFTGGGSTSAYYRTNGAAWNGQQSLWGGNSNWGFRLDYNIMAATDYTMGNGQKLPTGYNNQFFNFAAGFDLSQDSSLEVKYLHAQQNNVFIPGLLTDINNLDSDAFTLRYTIKDTAYFDQLAIDGWVNNTNFNGDSANPATRQQTSSPIPPAPGVISTPSPGLNNIFPTLIAVPGFSTASPVRLDINTQGTGLSYGARETTTWGDAKGFNIAAGADIHVFTNQYNEFDAFNLSVSPGSTLPVNLGIPNSRWLDPGLFADASIPMGEQWNFKVGGRVDFSNSQILNFGQNFALNPATSTPPINSYTKLVGPLSVDESDKFFFLFSGFGTGEYKINDEWTATAAYGYAQRPPTLTELFAGGAFLGLIQNGLNSIYGNPELKQEQIHQIDLGIKAKYEQLRLGGNAFYAFMPDYITYNPINSSGAILPAVAPGSAGSALSLLLPGGVLVPSGTGLNNQINLLRFTNTNLATMYGFEGYFEYDVLPWLTPFGVLNFVEGWDQTRDVGLPGIPPLDTRAGLRVHQPGQNPRWGVEYFARMVATQDIFARNLGEQATASFIVHYVRGYWQVRDNILVLGGVENIGDLFYREHLDLRTGAGVFQPGINFYFGTKITY